MRSSSYEADCSLSLCLLNVQSLNNKVELLNEFWTENDLDIPFFTECWLRPCDSMTIRKLENNDEFRFISKPRTCRTGGGLGCLHKRNIKIDTINMPAYRTFELLALNLSLNKLNLTILIIYRPEPSPKNNYRMSDFFSEFTELLAANHESKNELLIIGDFNFHVNKPYAPNTRKLNDLLKMFSLTQHISEPTHIRGNTLDLLITRDDSKFMKNHKVGELLSDHSSILFNINAPRPTSMQKTMKFRKMRSININEFKSDIRQFLNGRILHARPNISNPPSLDKLKHLVSAYEDTKLILDKHAPMKEKSITVRKPTPWNRDDIREAKVAKRKAEKKWRKSKNPTDLSDFKMKRNSLNTLLAKLKTDHLSKQINDNKGNSKALFKIVNSELNRRPATPFPPNKSNETLVSDFSNFFEDKIDKIRKNLDRHANTRRRNSRAANSQTFSGTPLCSFARMNMNEVRQIINKMAAKHSKLDPLPTWLVKNCLNELLPTITEIINTSLELGTVPTSYKHAIITPLLKKANMDLEMKNYRPVSNLKFLSKVVEGAVIAQLTKHFNANDLQDPRQSAYKTMHSTETLLAKIHNDIMRNGNNGKLTMLVLLDLSAAFDTIDHETLLTRLENTYGIKGTALKWFRSYLTSRTQSVIIDDTISERKHLKYGVPQGSKLGPILFNSYIAPLSEVARKHGIDDEKYADDEQLILSFSPTENAADDAKSRMENCISDIREFLLANRLCNNSEKTEIIILGQKQSLGKVHPKTLTIDNKNIEPADYVKNLGVIFDKHMTMEKQVNKMCQSAYFNIRNIGRIRNCLSKNDTKTVVNSLVTPHLDYGNGLLYGTKRKLQSKLQVAQNSAVRLIERIKKREHLTKYRKGLHWLPIPARIRYKIITTTWKTLNDMAPRYLKQLIKPKSSSLNLRSNDANLALIPNTRINNNWGTRALCMSGPTLWNQLPPEIRRVKEYTTFKKHLKTYLFNKYYQN